MNPLTLLLIRSPIITAWLAGQFQAHLCAAGIIRAMPENEIPPVLRGDFYCCVVFCIGYAFLAFFASLKTILLTMKKTTIETPPLRTVVTML